MSIYSVLNTPETLHIDKLVYIIIQHFLTKTAYLTPKPLITIDKFNKNPIGYYNTKKR